MESAVNRNFYGPKLSTADWVQVNDTMLPCVHRNKQCFVPLNILQNAVGILTDANLVMANSVDRQQSTRTERTHLNRLCAKANIPFPPFPETTLLVSLRYLHTLEVGLTEMPSTEGPELDGHTVDSSNYTYKKKTCVKRSISFEKRPLKKEDYELAKSSSEQTKHPRVGSVEKCETLAPTASGFKLGVVRLFGKPIPCLMHNSEVYASTDSLYKMFTSSSNYSSIENLNCKMQTLKVPLYCISNCSEPPERNASPKALQYFKLKDVVPQMKQLKKLLIPTKDCAQFNRLKLDDDVYRRRLAPPQVVTPEEAPLDLSMKSHGKPTVVEPVVSRACRSRVLPLVSEMHSVSKVPEQLPKNCSSKRKVTQEGLEVASRDRAGAAVKKKSRLEDAISRLVQGKGN